MKRELKKWAIKRVRKATLIDGLSNVVTIWRPGDTPRYVRISYDPSLAIVVGKALPYGLRWDFPAKLMIWVYGGTVTLRAGYIGTSGNSVHVCDLGVVPEWALPQTRKKHGHKEVTTPSAGTSSRADR